MLTLAIIIDCSNIDYLHRCMYSICVNKPKDDFQVYVYGQTEEELDHMKYFASQVKYKAFRIKGSVNIKDLPLFTEKNIYLYSTVIFDQGAIEELSKGMETVGGTYCIPNQWVLNKEIFYHLDKFGANLSKKMIDYAKMSPCIDCFILAKSKDYLSLDQFRICGQADVFIQNEKMYEQNDFEPVFYKGNC